MAVKCPICHKGTRMVTSRVLLRGHYNPTGKSLKRPNLQWARVDGKRVRICTDCIKTLAKTPRIRTKTAQA
jgi:ribosomal protein L28